MAESPYGWLPRAVGGALAGEVIGLGLAAMTQAGPSPAAWVALLTLGYLGVVTALVGAGGADDVF